MHPPIIQKCILLTVHIFVVCQNRKQRNVSAIYKYKLLFRDRVANIFLCIFCFYAYFLLQSNSRDLHRQMEGKIQPHIVIDNGNSSSYLRY